MWRLQTITQGTRFVWLVFIWNILKCKKILDSISRKSSKKRSPTYDIHSHIYLILAYVYIYYYSLGLLLTVCRNICRVIKVQRSQSQAKPTMYLKNQAYFFRQSLTNLISGVFWSRTQIFCIYCILNLKKITKKDDITERLPSIIFYLLTIEIWMAITWLVLSNMTLQHLSLKQNKLWNLYNLLLYLWSARILKILCLSFRNHSKPKWETIYKCMQPGDEHHRL